jgi:hypothetical protein
MRNMQTVKIPETTKEVYVNTTCDMCGKITDNISDSDGFVSDITIENEKMMSTYHDIYVKKTFVELCPECFENELLPFLRSKNCKIQTIDVEC